MRRPFALLSLLPLAASILLSCQDAANASAPDTPVDTHQQDSIARADSISKAKESASVLYAIKNPAPWVDSVFNTLSPDEKIAQLFTVAIYPYKASNAVAIESLLQKHAIGGIITMKGGPVSTAQRINKYQSMSRVPLLVSTDAEWGVKMRLDSVIRFPYQLTLGAMADEELIYEMGVRVGKQHERLGIHVNFAPVVDINNNPNNPVIGMRSFGENKENVTRKALAYAQGMQDNNVMAIAKHFPGHGDTDVDSHYDLPVITHDMERLNNTELYPFKQLINQGLGGMMTTHLFVPALDSTPNLAAGLSQHAVTDVLKGDLGFEGLIYTDALNMKGVTKHFPNGEIDVRALIAGNDVMLMSENIETSIAAVTKAIDQGEISWEAVDQKVKKILAVKFWAGLSNYQPADTQGLIADLNHADDKTLNQKIADKTITVLKAEAGALNPLKADEQIAIVTIGKKQNTTFVQGLKAKFPQATHYYFSSKVSAQTITAKMKEIRQHSKVLVAVHANGFRPSNNYGITTNMGKAIEALSGVPGAMLFLFADAYSLGKIYTPERFPTIVTTYQNTTYTQTSALKLLQGEIKATGKLPVTINDQFKEGMQAQ